jgi:hypothetical protein
MTIFLIFYSFYSDSARHRSQDICPPISENILKNCIKICLIKEYPEEILVKWAIVLKISKSSWNAACPNSQHGFLMWYVMVLLVFNCWRCEVVFFFIHLLKLVWIGLVLILKISMSSWNTALKTVSFQQQNVYLSL